MIKSIRIKNFKNFRDAEFDVRPLNIFIGLTGPENRILAISY